MWRWSFFLCAATELVCQKYTCVPILQETCVAVTSVDVVLSQCRVGFECPDFSAWERNNRTCAPVHNQTNTESECLPRSIVGSLCTAEHTCATGLYCNTTHQCAAKVPLGGACSHLRECGGRAVCNRGTCIPHFSLSENAFADSRMACTSGLIREGICQSPVVSRETLPVMCNSDVDCIGTDNSTTKCECGVNRSGHAYCHLHPSDHLVLKFLKAVHNGDLEQAANLRYWVINYPLLVNFEDCFKDAVTELKISTLLDRWEERCEFSSAWIPLFSVVYMFLL